jgi:hypothetical protein
MGGVSLGLHHQVLPFLSSADLLQGLKYGEINREDRSSASTASVNTTPGPDPMSSVPLAAVFSFLKDARGTLTWTARDS